MPRTACSAPGTMLEQPVSSAAKQKDSEMERETRRLLIGTPLCGWITLADGRCESREVTRALGCRECQHGAPPDIALLLTGTFIVSGWNYLR